MTQATSKSADTISSVMFNELRSGFIRQQQLLDLLPFSSATLWRKVKASDFPAPLKLSKRVTAWRVEEVREWLDKLQSQGK